MTSPFLYLVAGALGALVKDCVKDGKIQLPFFQDGFFYMGFLGGMVIGAFVGWVVDSNLITATLAGYVGTSAISHLLPHSNK